MGAKTLLRPELRDRLVESKWTVQFGHTGQIMRKSYERVITSQNVYELQLSYLREGTYTKSLREIRQICVGPFTFAARARGSIDSCSATTVGRRLDTQ